MINDSTVIGYYLINNQMNIVLKNGEEQVCFLQFPNPYLTVNGIGTRSPVVSVGRTAATSAADTRNLINIKIESIEFPDNCTNTDILFRLKLAYRDGATLVNTRFLDGTSDCFTRICWEDLIAPKITCGIVSGDTVNPYRLGLLGVHRPLRSLTYLADRTRGPLRDSGTFTHFTPYNYANPAQNPNWQFVLENNAIDPFGKVLETRDPLNRYDADLYGYDHNLVIASAKNARYRQLAFDGFEDYDYQNHVSNTGECEMPEHFSFQPYKSGNWVDSISHTGYGSLKISRNNPISLKRTIKRINPALPAKDNILAESQLLGVFNPDTGIYVFSAWVFHENINKRDTAFSVTIKVHGSGLPDVTLAPGGKRVEGWQQVNGTFRINEAADSIEIVLKNSSSRLFFLDDLRIHPFDAMMSSFVYDPVTLKLMAQLDDNNFATLYEYDEEGNLARIKKETEKGILTIEEVRAGKPKQ